jgi:DNA-binding GntR family transcriptional regulator
MLRFDQCHGLAPPPTPWSSCVTVRANPDEIIAFGLRIHDHVVRCERTSSGSSGHSPIYEQVIVPRNSLPSAPGFCDEIEPLLANQGLKVARRLHRIYAVPVVTGLVNALIPSAGQAILLIEERAFHEDGRVVLLRRTASAGATITLT